MPCAITKESISIFTLQSAICIARLRWTLKSSSTYLRIRLRAFCSCASSGSHLALLACTHTNGLLSKRRPDGTSRDPRRGAVLIEVVLAALVWGVLVGSAHFATIRYWRDRLHDLDKTRLYYDGIQP